MASLAFDEHAAKYDSWFMKNHNVLASEVLLIKHFLKDAGRALSVGCGSGLFESFLSRNHGIAIREGIEPSEPMAEIARKRGMKVSIASAEEIPFESSTFDTVLMNGLPAYLRDLHRPFEEAYRVLKDGGRVVVGDVPASSSYGMLYRMAGIIGTWDDPRLRQIAPEDPYPVEFVQSANWRTTGEVAAGLRDVGFKGLEFSQTLTTHAKFSNEAVEGPIPGFDKGGYVAIRGQKRGRSSTRSQR
jgi:ubiquinone/menaquinone biosynthesis C-methylase UbiE